ncbi:hypothetical protein [Nitrosomonas sp. sh817]|uniref:hypothetical protein n=1 Tax=Nitrosomonas sp. sh817 TaxID=3070658 RepID=UPI0027DDDB04|nr:hypothetical protein [Nitrosomonas sp. sh817]WMJ08695.1 hypothetical protein RBH92_00360 [Nitrosomonas sp. sh817]
MDFSVSTFCLVALSMGFANVCGTLYFINLSNKNPHAAAFWSAVLILANAFTITSYVENHAYVAAAFIGTYLGAYGTLKWQQKRENS